MFSQGHATLGKLSSLGALLKRSPFLCSIQGMFYISGFPKAYTENLNLLDSGMYNIDSWHPQLSVLSIVISRKFMNFNLRISCNDHKNFSLNDYSVFLKRLREMQSA